MRIIWLLSVLIVLAGLLVRPVRATVSCTTQYGQYGGGQTCISKGELLLNKKVFNPNSNSFVDNLGRTDRVFNVGEEVVFQIEVKNVGDSPIRDITVTDTLPNFLTWTGGDGLTSTISNLNAGESAIKTIRTKVVNPGGAGVVCAMNSARVAGTIIPISTTTNPPVQPDPDNDSAQVCVNLPTAVPLKVAPPVPVKETPPTGPEYLLWLIPVSGIGFYLKRFSSRG